LGEPLVMTRPNSQRLFYEQNASLSVYALTTSTGAVVESYQYDAYGRQTVIAGTTITPGGASTVGNPFLFVGMRLDAETNLYYVGARYYNAVQNRFISSDPIGSWGDPGNNGNGYAYVGDNPVNGSDPSGLLTCRKAGEYGPPPPPQCINWSYSFYQFSSFPTKAALGSELELALAGSGMGFQVQDLMVTDVGGGSGLALAPCYPQTMNPACTPITNACGASAVLAVACTCTLIFNEPKTCARTQAIFAQNLPSQTALAGELQRALAASGMTFQVQDLLALAGPRPRPRSIAGLARAAAIPSQSALAAELQLSQTQDDTVVRGLDKSHRLSSGQQSLAASGMTFQVQDLMVTEFAADGCHLAHSVACSAATGKCDFHTEIRLA